MAYNLPDGVTQGMIDAELGDDNGGCEGCPDCIEPTEGELIPMPTIIHCHGCSAELPRENLYLCLKSLECIEHRGPMCAGCHDAHTITAHEGKEQAA